jgi:hypothetical protein
MVWIAAVAAPVDYNKSNLVAQKGQIPFIGAQSC